VPAVLESFARVATEADIVLVEGAGSPAEVNLRAGDIANMGFAAAADVPVVLIGDIDRGGVIASLVGTHAVLPGDERDRIKGFVINKFRGDATLFRSGEAAITQMTGWPSLGLVPWLPAAAWLPAEDAFDLETDGSSTASALSIAVPMLSRVANFDDFDPLRMEPNVNLIWVRPGEPIPASADVVLLPGTKSTIGDLAFLREQGWDIDIKAHVRHGGHVLGICGGFQLLGKEIVDPDGFDGAPGRVEGLGLLAVTTTMNADKATTAVTGTHCASGSMVSGYEIHLGRVEGDDCARPVLTIAGKPEGASSADGRVQGTHVHGLFTSDVFRRAWLKNFDKVSALAYEQKVESAIDTLADHLEAHLDVEGLLAIARSRQTKSASAA
jgi:adenosylcobyric acid synthase